jgi:hypothetical protein
LVQQAAAGSRPQSGCRGTPGASAPRPTPAQGEAEAARDCRTTQACGAEPGIDARADGAFDCCARASAAARPRQCVSTSATNVGIAVPAAAGDAIKPWKRGKPGLSGKIMDDQGFIRHIGLTIS